MTQEMPDLDVRGKPQRGVNPHKQAGTEDPTHIQGFSLRVYSNLGPQRRKAGEETTLVRGGIPTGLYVGEREDIL